MAQDDNKTWKADSDPSHFIKKAAMIDKKEIRAGKMAQEKAMNPQVRSYGEMMVTHHTNSSSELRTLASRKNITLPSDYAMNSGATSSNYMGTEGQSSYSGTSASNWNRTTGTISERSYRGTANMRLSKAQTTPDRRYYNGTPTNWTDKHVNKASQTTSAIHSNEVSAMRNEGISGQNMTTATGNANMNTDWSNGNSTATTAGTTANTGTTAGTTTNTGTSASTTTNTEEETGVSSDGNLGVSGTTGTLTTNAAFNGAEMGTDSIAVGTSSTTQSMATGTATTINDTNADMTDESQDKLNMLGQKSGAEFDRAYIDMMVDGHSKAIQLYEKASKSSDSDISTFATKMLPTLKQHQERAKTLQTTVTSSNSGL